MSSNAALQASKRLYRASKAGHAGTLDPLATGLLPILFGEATKFAAFLLDADKEYLATVKLGETTTTGDAEGEVIERRAVSVTNADLESALTRFRGEILQTPPMYSALKRAGRPLYELARQGLTVQRVPRRVVIQELILRDRQADTVQLQVRCSKGTYVRTLAEDIGAVLATGGHLTGLVRQAAGGYRLSQALSLDELEAMSETERDKRLLSLDGLLAGLLRANLDADLARRFRNGQSVAWQAGGAGIYAVYGPSGTLLGLGQPLGDGSLRPVRLTAFRPDIRASG